MKSSPGTRRATLSIAMTLAAGFATSCAAPQPEECAAFLACFYPAQGESRYAQLADAGFADLVDDGEVANATYGPAGECWRNGESDPLYATCRQACIGAMLVECEAASSGTRAGVCVEGSGDGLDFVPPGQDELRQSCGTLSGG